MTSEGLEQSARLDPVQGVLEVLDRASMTGTNKLGLLLALLDLAPTVDGEAPIITSAQIAERYLEIHWEHARPYAGPDGDVVLRQSSVRKKRNDGSEATDTVVMQEIHRLRCLLADRQRVDLQGLPLDIVKHQVANCEWQLEWNKALKKALDRIRAFLLKNPVHRLQQLPGGPDPFLYKMTLDRSGLKLLPGVVESLTRFAGILRPLVEFRFAQAVVNINHEQLKLPVDDVYSHLFGRERIMPPQKMRERIIEIQRGKCIFTDKPISAAGGSLDHVMPWSRVRLSQIENFVMTTRSVNSKKSDSLLAPAALERWVRHIHSNSEEFQACARDHNWPTGIDSVLQVAHRIYAVLDASTGVWDNDQGIQPLGDNSKLTVLKMLQR